MTASRALVSSFGGGRRPSKRARICSAAFCTSSSGKTSVVAARSPLRSPRRPASVTMSRTLNSSRQRLSPSLATQYSSSVPISVQRAASVTGTCLVPLRLPPRRTVCNGGSCSSWLRRNRQHVARLVVAADRRGEEREQHRLAEGQFQFRLRQRDFLAFFQSPRDDAQDRRRRPRGCRRRRRCSTTAECRRRCACRRCAAASRDTPPPRRPPGRAMGSSGRAAASRSPYHGRITSTSRSRSACG